MPVIANQFELAELSNPKSARAAQYKFRVFGHLLGQLLLKCRAPRFSPNVGPMVKLLLLA
jgi:hypothetical protein